MARLWSSGFELNTTTTDVEWGAALSTPSIQTGTVRTGTYALEITSLASGTGKGLPYTFVSANANGPYYCRFYFRYATLPTANNTILRIGSSGPAELVNIKLSSTGVLRLFNTTTQVGSDSSAINVNTWYRVEVLFDATGGAGAGIARARIDGVEFAASTSLTYGAGVNKIIVGGNLALTAETQTTGDWFFDDIAINDSNGSFQNSYPGAGSIIHLKPNAAGDSNGFLVQVGGTAGSANNYTRVNEVTPDDATTYNGAALLNAEDLFNVDDSGIGGADTVNVVAVGARMADLVGADATAAFKLEIEKTSGGTKSQSSTIIPNSTSWLTNASASPRNYALTTYQDPDSSNWTKTTLDSMQIGYTQTATNVQTIAVSTVWALVDYTPLASPAPNVSDTSAVTESVGYYSELVATRESVTVVVTAAGGGININDTSAITENIPTPSISYQPNVSDTSAITENIVISLTSFVNVSDTSAVTENLLRIADTDPKVSDTSAVTENAVAFIPFYCVNVSDSSTVTENVIVNIPGVSPASVQVSDSSTITENIPTPQVSYQVNVNDISAITENIVLNDIEIEIVSDSSAITESVKLLVDTNVAVSDNSAIADPVSLLIPFLLITVSDTSSVTESIGRMAEEFINVSNASSITDSVGTNVTAGPTLLINVSDTSNVSEHTAMNLPGASLPITVNDNTTISDSFSFRLIGGFWYNRKGTTYNSPNSHGWYTRKGTTWEDQS